MPQDISTASTPTFLRLLLNGTANSEKSFRFLTNGVNRYILGIATAETGSNAGSDFTAYRYADDGTYLGTPLIINRATGNVTLEGALTGTELNLSGQGRFKGWYVTGSGHAVEVGVSGGGGNVISYDRTLGTYKTLSLSGYDVNLSPQGGAISLNGITSITGALTGTSATFSGAISASNFNFTSYTNRGITYDGFGYAFGGSGYLGTNAFTNTSYLPLTGGTLTGALAGTSAKL